jgi:hypothetical protein
VEVRPKVERRRAPWLVGAAAGLLVASVALMTRIHGKTSTSDAPAKTPTANVAAAMTAPAAAATPAVARVEVVVRSEPEGAQVLVDHQARGVTPLTIKVPLPQPIELELSGYKSAHTVITSSEELRVPLLPEPPKHAAVSRPKHSAAGKTTSSVSLPVSPPVSPPVPPPAAPAPAAKQKAKPNLLD